MNHIDHVNLLRPANLQHGGTWADFGAGSGAFTSGNLANGKTYSFTFTTPGTYAYHCAIHTYMKATIIVQ